jgi:hypothetical protein
VERFTGYYLAIAFRAEMITLLYSGMISNTSTPFGAGFRGSAGSWFGVAAGNRAQVARNAS